MKECSLFVKLKIAGYVCAALGWWGMLYPEFAMTEDMYRIVYTEEEIVYEVNDSTAADDCLCEYSIQNGCMYWEMLQAGPEKIQIRSKFLEKLNKQ